MRINLHMHSRYSDGSQWPEEMAARAARLGIEAASLTDHDSMEGTEAFLAACQAFGVRGIAGVEIDCVSRDLDFDSEILGYFPKGPHAATSAFLSRLLSERAQKMRAYLERARALFHREDLTLEDMQERKREGAPVRDGDKAAFTFIKPNLFDLLKEKGVLEAGLDYPAFKKRYASTLFPATGVPEKPQFMEAVECVRADGGVLVLAHPALLCRDNPRGALESEERYRKLFAAAAGLGFRAAEMNWYGHDTADINAFLGRLARECGLMLTWGCDCHGRGSPHDRMALFHGEVTERQMEDLFQVSFAEDSPRASNSGR